MLSLKQKAEMKSVIEQIYIFFPPHGIWQEFKPHLTPKVATHYENYGQGLGKNLDAFCSDIPEPNLSSSNPPLQKLISVASHYYKITFLMICQSEQKFLRPEVESWGIGYPFDKQFFLFRLMVEDCSQYLEMLQHAIERGSYESLSGQDWLDDFYTVVQYLKGEISRNVLIKSGQRLLKKEEKFKNSLDYFTRNPNFYKCNLFCLEVWYKHQKEISAYNSWVEAMDQWRTMFTNKASPACGMAKKIVAIRNFQNLLDINSYPGRGKSKKKGFS